MSHSDGNSSHCKTLLSDVSIELCHLLLVNLIEFGVDVSSGIDDVFSKELLIDLLPGFLLDASLIKQVVGKPLLGVLLEGNLVLGESFERGVNLGIELLVHLRMALHVGVDHKRGQSIICFLINLILDH